MLKAAAAKALYTVVVFLTTALGLSPPMAGVQPAAISQSVVHLRMMWTAKARTVGSESDPRPIQAEGGCTAWVADSHGHIVTDGHCVNPVNGKIDLAKAYYEGTLMLGPGSDPDKLADRLVFSDLDVTVTIDQPNTEPGNGLSFHDVKIITYQPSNGMDAALLQVPDPQHQLKPLRLADSPPTVLEQVVAVGYPGEVGPSFYDPPLVFEPGSVVGTTTLDGEDMTLVSSHTWLGMSGGPDVNQNGEVVGTNEAVSIDGQGFNYINTQQNLQQFLGENGIANPPLSSPMLSISQPVIWVGAGYMAIALTVWCVAAIVVMIVAVRRRRKQRS